MFCILYKLEDGTKIKFYEKENCFPECKYFKEDKCSLIKKQNVKLTNERFGWVIENTIVFPEFIPTKHANSFYNSFLHLIHPVEKDIWIIKCLKKDKTEIFYSVFSDLKRIDFNDLKALNYWLYQRKFNGRELNEEDFI